MSGNMGNIALEGGDPRGNSVMGTAREKEPGTAVQVTTTNSTTAAHKLHDPSVYFEEYLHYAQISRNDARFEDQDHQFTFRSKKKAALPGTTEIQGHDGAVNEKSVEAMNPSTEKEVEGGSQNSSSGAPAYTPRYLEISDEEWVTASRAARTATWGAVFYLITTDILGPFSVSWAFWKLGYGPGVILYTVFGAFAGFGGFLLWRMFLGLDSDRYPLKTYGDIAFRVYGTVARHSVNVLQSVQLLFNVGIIVILNGQSLSEIANNNTCFIILCFVWVIAGAVFGQIRTLQNLGWLANAAIWMNLFVIFLTMGIVANSEPNYDAGVAGNVLTDAQGATDHIKHTTAGPGLGVDFTGQVVGLMQAVYSYGGAMLFVEFMSEMRHPWDFWKGMLCAQLFIYFFYLFFGIFVYAYQGQYTINPAYQGISSYGWQTAANAIELVTTLIAALLYGNIGIKVIYNNVLIDLFGLPTLVTRRGKLLWVAVVPVYWATAFVIAAAIPQVGNLSGLIAAACILQFTYTFPPFFMIGYQVKRDALVEGEGFDRATGTVTRHDAGMRRWVRGFMKQPGYNAFLVFYTLGSAATAVLGIYSGVVQIKASYAAGSPPSFSCTSPLELLG